jgi:hypothetical protein
MATEIASGTSQVRRNTSLPEPVHQDAVLLSSRPKSLGAESTTDPYLKQPPVTDNPPTLRDDTLYGVSSSPGATTLRATCLSYRPTAAVESSVPDIDINPITRAYTPATFDACQSSAAPISEAATFPETATAPAKNQTTSSNIPESILGGHEVSLTSAPTEATELVAKQTPTTTQPSNPHRRTLKEKRDWKSSLARKRGDRNADGNLTKEPHQARRPTPLPPASSLPDTSGGSEDASVTWRAKAVDAAKLHTFKTLTHSGDDKAPKTATLNIAATQRLVLAYQQRKISRVAAQLYVEQLSEEGADTVFDNLARLIHTNCKSASCGKTEQVLTQCLN